MGRMLLDTDICSEVLKAVDPVVRLKAVAYVRQHGRLTFSSITVLEMLYGFRRRSASVRLERAARMFSSPQEIVPDAQDYRLAAEIMGTMDIRGTRIGMADPLIAACALNRDLTLATGNARHFGSVRDAGFPLRLEDWRAA